MEYSEQKAKTILRSMGVTSNRCGYRIALEALACVASKGECMESVFKEIAIPVAEKLDCSSATIEVNLRRISETCWKNCPELLQSLSAKKLTKRPTASYFLEIIFYACTECDESLFVRKEL